MLSRLVRNQLIIFTTISVVSIVVIATIYAKVPDLLGLGQRTIYAQFTDGSGLYGNAQVTYDGVAIGKVTSVAPDPAGARATMSVSDSYQIPADVEAEVESVSPIGEQYIDLVPPSNGGGAPLADNATIPVSHTVVPIQIGTLLDNLNTLLQTLPRKDLQTTLTTVSQAFNGTGDSLRATLQAGEQLLDDAQNNIAPTQQLIKAAAPLLKTQTASSAQIKNLVSSLAGFTGAVQASDGTIADLTKAGTQMIGQANSLFQTLEPTLPILLENLVNVEQVLVTYNPALRQILVVYPRITTALISTTKFNQKPGDSGLGLDFRLIAQDPPPCETGFVPASQNRSPNDMTYSKSAGVYCKLPQNSPSTVRGVRNIPCINNPAKRAATVQQCLGEGYAPESETSPAVGSITSSGTYDPGSGTADSADGQFFMIGGTGTQAPSKNQLRWQELVLAPIGQ